MGRSAHARPIITGYCGLSRSRPATVAGLAELRYVDGVRAGGQSNPQHHPLGHIPDTRPIVIMGEGGSWPPLSHDHRKANLPSYVLITAIGTSG